MCFTQDDQGLQRADLRVMSASQFAGCLHVDDSKLTPDDTSPFERKISERGRDRDDDDGPASVLLD